MIRVLSNGYPSYAFGVIDTNRSGTIDISTVYDSATGEQKTTDDLKVLVSAEEMIASGNEHVSDLDTDALLEEISAYKADAKSFWETAESSPQTVTFEETAVTRSTYYKVGLKNYSKDLGVTQKWKTGWCGPSAICWALGYLNYIGRPTGFDPTSIDDFKDLSDSCGVVYGSDQEINGITWPYRLNNAVEDASGDVYTTTRKFIANVYSVIDSDYPLLSLRGIRWGSFSYHYRDVVGYKCKGCWLFKWPYVRIHDPNNLDGYGDWECYNPLYHLMFYAIKKN